MQIMSRQFLLAFVAATFTYFPLYGQDEPTRIWERRQSLDISRLSLVSVEEKSNPYHFYQHIASGSFGSVDLVFREGPLRWKFYAQKKYKRPPFSDFEEFIENMEYLKTLEHPNIVSIKAVHYPSLIMEYLAGEELHKILYQNMNFYHGSMEYELEKKIILRQIFSALQFLEEKGICHFDIKPENFVFKNPLSTKIKMVDFDFMSRYPHDIENIRVCGTHHYFAPELLYYVARGVRYDQSKRDMWAAGLLASEVLSGVDYDWGISGKVEENSYKKQIKLAIMDRTKEMNLPHTPVPLDPDMKELLLHLLVKDPENRWTAAQAFSSPYFTLPAYTEPEDGIEITIVPQDAKIETLLKGKPLTMRISPAISVSALMDQIMLKYGIRKSAFSVWREETALNVRGVSKIFIMKVENIKKSLESYNIQERPRIYLNVKDFRYDP